MKFDIFFKFILRKRGRCTLNPSYLGNLSVATVTMDVISLQPTLLCVITLCVFLSIIYDQDVPFLEFVILFIVVVFLAFIVVGNHLLRMDWLVVIPMGNIICLPARGAGVCGVSFVRLSPIIPRRICCAHSCGESPIWKGLVCRNLSGNHYLPPDRGSERGCSVLYRVSFV